MGHSRLRVLFPYITNTNEEEERWRRGDVVDRRGSFISLAMLGSTDNDMKICLGKVGVLWKIKSKRRVWRLPRGDGMHS